MKYSFKVQLIWGGDFRLLGNSPLSQLEWQGWRDILFSVRAPFGKINIADYNCCIGRGLAALNQ